MAPKLLLTSFQTWMAHHTSNSSDDLLAEMLRRNLLPENTHLLRHLPVDFQRAPETVLAEMEQIAPDIVLCCGMAETRSQLSLEARGRCQGEDLFTIVPLENLMQGLTVTHISQDAGNFVCNHLYYSVLRYIHDRNLDIPCLFIHVPLLHEENLEAIVADFQLIIQRVQELKAC